MNPLGRYAGIPALVRKEQALDLFAALIAAGLIVLTLGRWSGVLRILMALAFTFFVPGRAIVTNWPRVARWSAATMPMVLSLAVLSLLATVALWARVWHPVQIFEIEASLSLAGLSIGMTRRHSALQVQSCKSREYPGDDMDE
jgi:uncharacterized membrane protein